jgi:hypothetical protein
MTQDYIIKLAREAGAIILDGSDTSVIERFAALVRADEREACAKLCDELHYEADAYGAQCAAAIRARGNT